PEFDITIISRMHAVGSKVFAVGMQKLTQGTLFISMDGGATWIKKPLPQNRVMESIYMINELEGYLGGFGMFFTPDGGKNFDLFFPEVSGEKIKGISDIYFFDKDRGYIVAGEYQEDEKTGKNVVLAKGALLFTKDGGKTWDVLYSGKEEYVMRIAFATEDFGWFLGYDNGKNFLKKTEDGGKTFTEIAVPPVSGGEFKGFTDMHFFNRKAGWVSGVASVGSSDMNQPLFFRMKDGETLTIDESYKNNGGGQGGLLSMRFIDQKNGYAVGEYLHIYRFTGDDGDIVIDNIPKPDESPEQFAPDAIEDVVFAEGDLPGGGDENAKSGGGCNAGIGVSPSALFLVLIGFISCLCVRNRRRFFP
ncbi:MAG: hypothetical protein FJ088_09900, partial [Deltaproteobacteria bacterium]|nr:hypothetical protein [Deltaproteobacteria bacterium]